MSIQRLLIANRGEISVRVSRAARAMGIETVTISPEDDLKSLHVHHGDENVMLPGVGAAAYLDIEAVISAAKSANVDAIHPGYGFLSENADFASRCAVEGIIFIGPDAKALALLADKSAARALAIENNVPVLAGRNEATSLSQATEFFEALEPGSQMFIKALSGGGGRGMRLVKNKSDIKDAFDSAAREAESAFGDGRLYVERLMSDARHIEVQIIGDGTEIVHLYERDCSLQRRNQKIIEIAPAPNLSETVRQGLFKSAVQMSKFVSYKGLGTFEFLVSANDDSYAFLEANPRVQVEHTVTEEILGLDLVQLQIGIAAGKTLLDLGVQQDGIAPLGYAVQARVNAEKINEDGQVLPTGGQLTVHELPQGRGVRIDSAAYLGWQPNPRYDSLLSKVIVSDSRASFEQILNRTYQALGEYHIDGVSSNLGFLRALLAHPDVIGGGATTQFVDREMKSVLAMIPDVPVGFAVSVSTKKTAHQTAPEGSTIVPAGITGTIVEIMVSPGDSVARGQVIAVLEAMKMEHQITATISGSVMEIPVTNGQTVSDDTALLFVVPTDDDIEHVADTQELDLDYIRPDLDALLKKRAAILDDARVEAVAKRHAKGKQTMRENIDRLVDEGSLSEYGGLNIALQRTRHDVETLERISPADGMIAGTASINGADFGDDKSSCVVLGYDYMVFAGTQGAMNHKKTDRLLHLAEARELPIIFYGEGGGGRPGDVDIQAASTLDIPTFQTYARLSGLVPRIGIASGRCFAGNAALMGVSDLLIATKDTSLGMGGPAMIEGGGLGVFSPEEVGPVSVQAPNGVIDVVVQDEDEATDVAKNLLSYFQGTVKHWEVEDQRLLRSAIPENRLRVYDIRKVISVLADTGSVQEIRPDFAQGMVTAFIRIEGRPMGLIANNPMHLGGAIDADGSEKAARHIQLCDAFDIPILTLCDTPGFMVGPDAEKTALVRKTARLFAAAGSVTVPVFTVILRKGYGLGAQAMGGGSMHAPFVCVSWPTGEMGPMGLEGAVRLGFKKELAAIEDEEQRTAMFNAMVDEAYTRGKAVNAAAFMEIDDVIDPADTRKRLVQGLKAVTPPTPRRGRKRTFVDTW
jgi:acetyl/propionyl-CoA carboxylase alpha subunit/acetyl-CoA carboxylase carboxyltransferase component